MSRLTKRYYEDIRRLGWESVLEKLGYTLPQSSHSLGRIYILSWFTNEKTPSLVLDKRGHYHCFSCGNDGDIFDLLTRSGVVGVSKKGKLFIVSRERGRNFGSAVIHGRPASKKHIINFFRKEFNVVP